jgi:5-methylcytosine-specific restriction endonuclease McrA
MGKCKSCVKSSVRENRRNRKQQYAEYERSRADLPHRIEVRRKYQEEHKEQIAEYKKAWTKANDVRTVSYKRAYYEQNREEVIARSKEWAENNLEKVKQCKANNNRKRRAAKHASRGNFTAKEFEELCERYGNRCLSCGSTGVVLEVDHIVPLTRGGPDDIDNIQPLCGTCNRSKFVKAVDYRASGHTPPGPQNLLGEACGVYHLRLDELLVEGTILRQPLVGAFGGDSASSESPIFS